MSRTFSRNPRSRGCGTRQCILLWCPSLIPGWITAHGLTDDQMMILDAVDLEAGRVLHDTLPQPHRGTEGKDDGRCGRGGWPFIPGALLSMIVEIQSDLLLEDRLHAQSHAREPGSGRNPCGFLSPHRADGGGSLAPAKPWFYGAMLLLIGLEYLGIWTALCPHGGRQDGPARRVGGRPVGLCLAPEAIPEAVLGLLGLGGTASLRAFLPLCDRFHLVMEGMIPPGPRLAPTPPLAAAFVLGHSGLRSGGPGQPAGVDPREMLGDLGRCLRLGCGLRDRRRVGPVAGVDHQQAACCPLEASGSLCHFPPADDTVPLPASR